MEIDVDVISSLLGSIESAGSWRKVIRWRISKDLERGVGNVRGGVELEVEGYIGRIATPARRCKVSEGKAVAKVVRRLACELISAHDITSCDCPQSHSTYMIRRSSLARNTRTTKLLLII